MEKITFVDNVTKANADTFNTMQDNIEDAIEEKQTYSTEEQVIGTWTNGKPLYRKVISTTLPNGSTDIVVANNIQIMFLDKGYFNAPSGSNNRYFTLPFINDSQQRVLGWSLPSTNSFHLVNEISSYNGYTCYLIMLYTKTTD